MLRRTARVRRARHARRRPARRDGPAAGRDAAREVLLQAELISDEPRRPPIDRPFRILAGLLIGIVVVGLIVWALTQLGS